MRNTVPNAAQNYHYKVWKRARPLTQENIAQKNDVLFHIISVASQFLTTSDF